MISVRLKDGENVDRALKRFKKKFEKAKILKQLREKTFFEKPSVTIRKQKQRAIHKQSKKENVEY